MMEDPDSMWSSGDEGEVVTPEKSYKNLEFMRSREARTIRVICEFEEPLQRLRRENVKETILFFGSSQALSRSRWEKEVVNAEERLATAQTDADKEDATEALSMLKRREWLCEIYEKVEELSRRLTQWSLSYRSSSVVGGGFLATGHVPDEDDEPPLPPTPEVSHIPMQPPTALHGKSSNAWADEPSRRRPKKAKEGNIHKQSLMVCTGGGGGLMRAANKGASRVKGAKTIGMGISLPNKARSINPYVTRELGFEFHYFFTRKYWMLYPCRALVVPAGGFYTMDTLFELLTLKQTGKIKIDIPVVMFGKKYWHDVIKWENLVKFGTISQKDHDDLFFTDSVEEAFNYITKRILELRDRDRELFYTRTKK